MPSVAEADHAEFAETAATLAPQIERFFYTRERSGGPNFPSTVPPPEGRPRACARHSRSAGVGRGAVSVVACVAQRPSIAPASVGDSDADDLDRLAARWHDTHCWPSRQIGDETAPTGYLANVHAKDV
jgi:hypothetical protein